MLDRGENWREGHSNEMTKESSAKGSIDEVPLEAGIGSTAETGRGRNLQTDDGPPRRFAGLFATVATTVSAALYLVDFVSNILVLKEYWDYYKKGLYHGYKDHGRFGPKPFFMCLGLMVSGHVGTIIAFKLKLPPQQQPLASAYFLPLLQFRRFVKGLIQTGSCARYKGPSEPLDLEAEALYAIVSAAIETGPQVALQFLVIVVVSRRVKSTAIPVTLVVSLVASFLSGIYNTGRAVMFRLSKRWTVILNNVGILAGLYTGAALLLRTVTMASVLNYWIFYFRPGFYLYFPAWLLPGCYLIGLICVSAGWKLLSRPGQLHAVVFGYVIFTLGPLYPVVDAYSHRMEQDQNSPEKYGMKYHLGLAAALNLLLDVVPLGVSGVVRQNPCMYNIGNGEKIITTLSCRNYLSYLVTGASLSIIGIVALIYLLHRVQKQEIAAVSDGPLTANVERPALVDYENQELPIRPSSREMKLVSVGSNMTTVSSQPRSNLRTSASFGSRRER